MNTLIFCSMFLMSATPSLEAGQRITLDEVLRYALTHNRTLKRSTLSVARQRATVKQAKAMFDVQVNAAVKGVDVSSSSVPGEFMTVSEQREFTFEAGMTKMLGTGGVIGVSAKLSSTRQNIALDLSAMNPTATPETMEVTSYTPSVTLMIKHPLLKGMGLAVNDAQVKIASLGVEIEQLNREATWQTTVRDIVTGYHSLSLAHKQYEVTQKGLEVAKSQLEQTRQLLEAHRATRSDLLAAQSAVAQREVTLISARSAILRATLTLKQLMGMKVTEGREYFRPVTPAEAGKVPDPRTLLTLALKRSREIQMLERQERILSRQELLARDATRPQLDLTLAAGPAGRSSTLTEAVSKMISFSGFTLSAGIDFRYSLGNRAARAAVDSTVASRKMTRLQKEDLANSVTMSAMLALDAYNSARLRHQASRLAVKVGRLHLAHEREKFALGKGTNHSVLLRLEELERAELALHQAAGDIAVARVNLDTLSGTVLGKYGLSLK